MQIFHRRRQHEDAPPVPSPASEPEGPIAPGVAVLLSPGVVDLEPALSRLLGPGFTVQGDGPGTDGVMIVGPLGPAAVAFLRASHPGVALLVVDRRWHVPNPNEAVLHLEAGADGYLASPLVAEVASHVRAQVRRRQFAGRAPVAAAAIPTRLSVPSA
jgi:hypothetical protein